MNGQPMGMHHFSSISGDIVRNHEFYTGVLGLRLVKKSVNQDAPEMYHLFYADAIGSPGSDTTFFAMPRAVKGAAGNNSIARLSFRVAGETALEYWRTRLGDHGTRTGAMAEVDGRLTLDFADPDGTELRLVDDAGAGEAHPWDQSPVEEAFQLRGLGYPILLVPSPAGTEDFLVKALRLDRVREYRTSGATERDVIVYTMGGDGPGSEVHVEVAGGLSPARSGAGSVHHIALRVPDREALEAWRARLDEVGYRNSGLIDRFWFESVYVREPNGILFELATDGPGFDVDEDLENLGERLSLPPFLEPRRAELESALPV